MRYRPGLPLVLRGVSFKVQGGERVGIAGRTGSGKSSMAVALLRTVEISGGSISIDDRDCSTLGLQQLRRACFIIPQDPVLFSATLRFNLDPFDEFKGEQIVDAVRKARLADLVATLPSGLDEQMHEGGANFSVGQRQLVCVARALLRSPKIVLLDEATASIDNDTDAAIQLALRETFEGATSFTIAHRLHTILDSDKILLLGDGKVLEFDKPSALLRLQKGHFRAMIDKSKLGSTHNLTELAERKSQTESATTQLDCTSPSGANVSAFA